MKIQTVDIIRDLVESLGVTITINSVTNNSPYYTLNVSCTWWLSINQQIEIAGKPYKIISFLINESLTVESVGVAFVPVPGTFNLAAPTYLHGTLKMAGTEVDAQTDKTILCPFVYLFEIIRDKKNTDEEIVIDRETDLRIFFLNSVDSPNWLTEDHYTNFVYPMQQMVDRFMNKVENSSLFTFNLRYDTTPLLNVSENGTQDRSIFDCNLSGIELVLFAEIRQDLSCVNQSGCIN